jgi:hypothetical protein
VDDTIRSSVRALISGRGVRVEDVAIGIEMMPATLYRRLGGKERQQAFLAVEMALLAEYFEASTQDLFDGLGGRLRPRETPPSRSGVSASRS